MKIVGDKMIVKMTAGAAISAGQVVYASAAGQVSPAATANARAVVGVANSDAAAGASVEVIIYGIANVVADGAIAVGDTVVVATTAGRVIAENSGTSGSTGGGVAHSHSDGSLAIVAGAVAVTSTAANGDIISGTTGDTVLSVDNLASHTHTYEHGRVLGKALSSATAAGQTITILVCLSG